MYSRKIKIGNSIVVHGIRAGAGASTLAALTASIMAARGNRTLLLSTDPDHPYDAVSLLAADVTKNRLDELVVLENSHGLTSDKLTDYVTFVSDSLGYIRASAKLGQLTKTPAKTLNAILDAACYEFRYVILDISYSGTPYSDAVIRDSDLVMHVLGQDGKSLTKAARIYKDDEFGEDKLVVPIVANYHEDLQHDTRVLKRALNTNDVFSILHSNEVFKATDTQSVYAFAEREFAKKPVSGFLFVKKKSLTPASSAAIEELNEVCELIDAALTKEE